MNLNSPRQYKITVFTIMKYRKSFKVEVLNSVEDYIIILIKMFISYVKTYMVTVERDLN